MMKLIARLASAAAVLALVAGCASSGSSSGAGDANGRMPVVDEMNLKRQILTDYRAQLTVEQQQVIYYSSFSSPDEAYALVQDFLDYNEQKAALGDPEKPKSASDVILTPDSGAGG